MRLFESVIDMKIVLQTSILLVVAMFLAPLGAADAVGEAVARPVDLQAVAGEAPGTLTLTWSIPIEYQDEVAYYVVYVQGKAHYTVYKTELILEALPGQVLYYVTAILEDGKETLPSNPVVFNAETSAGSCPGGIITQEDPLLVQVRLYPNCIPPLVWDPLHLHCILTSGYWIMPFQSPYVFHNIPSYCSIGSSLPSPRVPFLPLPIILETS